MRQEWTELISLYIEIKTQVAPFYGKMPDHGGDGLKVLQWQSEGWKEPGLRLQKKTNWAMI